MALRSVYQSRTCPTYFPGASDHLSPQSPITNHAASSLPLSPLTNHFSPFTAALAAQRMNLEMLFEILTDKEIEALKERAIRQAKFLRQKSAAVGSR
jgi:hypothetical protein